MCDHPLSSLPPAYYSIVLNKKTGRPVFLSFDKGLTGCFGCLSGLMTMALTICDFDAVRMTAVLLIISTAGYATFDLVFHSFHLHIASMGGFEYFIHLYINTRSKHYNSIPFHCH